MKKYLAMAALLFASSVYAEESVVDTSVAPEEIVITDKEVQEALEAAQTVIKALAEEVKEAAAQEQSDEVA